MESTCQLCGSKVAMNGDLTNGVKEGFECADCGESICEDCKSIGVAQKTDHCERCRG